MAEVVVGTFRPQPGQSPENMELPGPGLYEADFAIPVGIADGLPGGDAPLAPDSLFQKRFEFRTGGKLVRHIRSTVTGPKIVRPRAFDQKILTVRFEVIDEGPPPVPGFAEANLGTIMAVILRSLIGVAAIVLVALIVKALVEVRRLVESPAGAALVGGSGLLLAGVGVTLLLASKKG